MNRDPVANVPTEPSPPSPRPGRFNPMQPGLRADPYPVYRRYRELDPVHWNGPAAPGEGEGAWCVFRHDDVAAVLRDPRFGKNPHPNPRAGPFIAVRDRSMLSRNPPDHTRLRSLVSGAFAPAMIAAQRPRIAQVAEGLLDQVASAGRMDFIQDFAYPLPVIVIAEMLGVASQDYAQFKEWSLALSQAMDVMASAAVFRRADAVTVELGEYLAVAIAARRREPRADLLSALLASEQEGDKLSEDELIAMCILLLTAGHETTVNLLGNGLFALLRHPAELSRLRANPDTLAESAVEELLRYDSPVQMSFRQALQDVELNGRHIREGAEVVLVLGSANRDPDRFPDPDRLDLSRNPNGHSAFSRGIHFCLGAPLARAEGQIALSAVLSRFPELRLEDPAVIPAWRPGFVFHGLQTLPLRF